MIIYKALDLSTAQKMELKKKLLLLISHNISNLSKPCFQPSLKKYFHQILKITNIKESDIKKFTKELWKGRKEVNFDLHNDHIVIFYISLMNYFLNQKTKLDLELYMYFMHLIVLKYYLSVFKKFFKNYCNESIFKQSLETISRNHLFTREKTIGNAMYFLSNTYVKKFKDDFEEFDLDNVSLIIQEMRHRISQSMRSFANVYYQLIDNPMSGFKTEEDYEDDESTEKTKKNEEKKFESIGAVSKKITVYKMVDMKAFNKSKDLTKIKTSVGSLIINKLTDLKYNDDIVIILKLFIKTIDSSDQICGKTFYKYVKSLMLIKKSVKPIFFKQQINVLLLKLLREIGYDKNYDSLSLRKQFIYNQFLAFYICLIYRHTICGKI